MSPCVLIISPSNPLIHVFCCLFSAGTFWEWSTWRLAANVPFNIFHQPSEIPELILLVVVYGGFLIFEANFQHWSAKTWWGTTVSFDFSVFFHSQIPAVPGSQDRPPGERSAADRCAAPGSRRGSAFHVLGERVRALRNPKSHQLPKKWKTCACGLGSSGHFPGHSAHFNSA